MGDKMSAIERLTQAQATALTNGEAFTAEVAARVIEAHAVAAVEEAEKRWMRERAEAQARVSDLEKELDSYRRKAQSDAEIATATYYREQLARFGDHLTVWEALAMTREQFLPHLEAAAAAHQERLDAAARQKVSG